MFNILMNKFIAAVTVICFLSGIVPAPVSAAFSGSAQEKSFSIPAGGGKVTSSGYYGSADTVINIQDLHCHGEVQRNTVKILNYIDEKYGLKHVYLEGASQDVDTVYLTELMKDEYGRGAVEVLVDKGYLSSAEYYSALKNKKEFIKGIEDEKVYERTVELLNKIIDARPDVEKICSEMLAEIQPVKKDYFNRQTVFLDKLSQRHEKGKIAQVKFYEKLFEYAVKEKIDLSEYEALEQYIRFAGKSSNINYKKAANELGVFINIIKEKLPYSEFSALSGKSSNFSDLQAIADEFAVIEKERNICKENKLYNLKAFLDYLEFDRTANPIDMALKEKKLKNELYRKSAENDYEREVAFLSEYISTIRGYFTADITSEDLDKFEEEFGSFRKIWLSYFSENTAKKLDPYVGLLAEYHGNNIKRDGIFAGIISASKKGSYEEERGPQALEKIGNSLGKGEIKVIITGGFHSKGLEKILRENKINYAVITPKITKGTGEAHELYINTIKGYRDITRNTVKEKPYLLQPLNLGMPKMIEAYYAVASGVSDKRNFIYERINDFLEKHDAGNVEVAEWTIDGLTESGMNFAVTYASKTDGSVTKTVKYAVADGRAVELIDGGYAQINEKDSGFFVPMLIFEAYLKHFFKDTQSFGYRILALFILPVAEEFVFRHLPFVAAGIIILNPALSIPYIAAVSIGVFVFPLAHYIADKFAVKSGFISKPRSPVRVFVSSAVLTGVYAAANIVFLGMPHLIVGAVSLAHIINNVLRAAGIIENPILSLYWKEDDSPERKARDAIDGVSKAYKADINDNGPYTPDLKFNKEMIDTLDNLRTSYSLSYEFIAETINYFSTHILSQPYNKKVRNFIALTAPVSGYIKTDSGKNLLEEHFDYLLGQTTDMKGLERLYNIDILSRMSAKAYDADKKLGLRLIARLNDAGMLAFNRNINGIVEAYHNLPSGWANVYQSMNAKEIAAFYKYLGVPVAEIYKKRDKGTSVIVNDDYFDIFKRLPEHVYEKTSLSEQHAGEMSIQKQANSDYGDVVKVSKQFDNYSSLVDNNALALSALNRGDEEGLKDAIFFLEKMMNDLVALYMVSGEYNKSKEDKMEAVESVLSAIKEEIKEGVTPEFIAKHRSLKEHTDENPSVHGFINMIHQLAVKDFMALRITAAGSTRIVIDSEERFKKEFVSYDYSMDELGQKSIDFMFSLYRKYRGVNGLGLFPISKNGKFLFSQKIGVHNMDIFLDLSETNEGIRISYNEGSRNYGNRLRTLIFALEAAQLGMDIIRIDVDESKYGDEKGAGGFEAVFNTYAEFNDIEEYARVIKGIRNIIYNSGDMDHIYTERYDAWEYGEIPEFTKEDFRMMKGRYGTVPQQFAGTPFEEEWLKRHETKDFFTVDYKMDAVYDYFEIEEQERRNMNEIIKMYIDGNIVVNSEGKLELNKNFSSMERIINALNKDSDDASRKSQLMNLIDSRKMNLQPVGYMGKLIAVSGIVTVQGGYLSVRGVTGKDRKRLIFADVEYVDMNGNRKNLEYGELLKLLKNEGFAVKRQKERSRNERKDFLQSMSLPVKPVKDSVEILGTGISSGSGGYTSGKIVYDKEDVNDESIWVVGYTTPDDIEMIGKAKGLLNTGGAMFSHANIIAREKETAAVLISEQWTRDEIEGRYYTAVNKTENKSGFTTQEIAEKRIALRAGDRILINGETGSVLLFDNVDSQLLDEIQSAIDSADAAKIKEIVEANKNSGNIGQIIEYIYFQSIENESLKEVLSALRSVNGKSRAAEKMNAINENYVGEAYERIVDCVNSILNINEPLIAYNLILTLERHLNSINSDDSKNRIAGLKKRVESIKKRKRAAFAESVENIKKEMVRLSKKKKLSEKDIGNALRLTKIAGVWNNFYSYPEVGRVAEFLNNKLLEEINLTEDDIETGIKGFEDIKPEDVFKYGSKTTELAKMLNFIKSNGFEDVDVYIPYGIGISKDIFAAFFSENPDMYEEYLKKNAMFEDAVKKGDNAAAQETAKEIIKLIENTDSEAVKLKIESMTQNKVNYAVRSSGVGEDGSVFSFAGMGETKLNVGKEDLYDNVKQCWISFFRYRSVEYMSQNRQVVKPSILIQEMVENVEKSGVIFTRDSGGNLNIEAVLGLGDGLVSGRITPDHVTFNTANGRIEYTRAYDKIEKLVKNHTGGVRMEKLSNEEKIERILDENTINRLAELVFALEQDAGYPLDIEFAISEDGKIHILQRRAITTLETSPSENDATGYISMQITARNEVVPDDAFVNIAYGTDGNGEAASVTVYYSKEKRAFYMHSSQTHLMGDAVFYQMLSDRMNSDPVILRKFRRTLPVADRAATGSMTIIPLYYVVTPPADMLMRQRISSDNAARMLSAA